MAQRVSEDSRDGDWVDQAADAVERVVGTVRSKTTVPITTAARALVYGVILAVVGLTAVVLLMVGLLRALDVYLPGEVWSAYVALGVPTLLAGAWLWSKRSPKVAP